MSNGERSALEHRGIGVLMMVKLTVFRKYFAAFFDTALPFLIWWLLLTILSGFYPNFIKKEISLLLNEHLALCSIILLGCLEVFTVGLIMLLFGSLKAEQRRLIWVHEKLIASPTRFSSSLLAVAFGVIWGLVVSAFVWGDFAPALRLAFVSILLPGAAFLMSFFTRFPLYEKFPFVKSNHARVFGIAVCLGTFILASSTYRSLPYQDSLEAECRSKCSNHTLQCAMKRRDGMDE
jgi:hypothetical protein